MTSESDIKNEVRKELVRFLIAITKEDPIGAIVRCHLYVESLLLQIIEQGLSDPGAIELTRVSFPTKRKLTRASHSRKSADHLILTTSRAY
jgi:hypothetical protein